MTQPETHPSQPTTPHPPVPFVEPAPAAIAPQVSALPVRTPGTAPAIADSAITGSAFAPQPVQQPVQQPIQHDEHPLTSADIAYRYSKERATGVEASLRHLSARKPLSDLSDTDLGLVTVPATSLYEAVCADLGFIPTR
jgi:hypothetical protein